MNELEKILIKEKELKEKEISRIYSNRGFEADSEAKVKILGREIERIDSFIKKLSNCKESLLETNKKNNIPLLIKRGIISVRASFKIDAEQGEIIQSNIGEHLPKVNFSNIFPIGRTIESVIRFGIDVPFELDIKEIKKYQLKN
jgi:hypothetical protein